MTEALEFAKDHHLFLVFAVLTVAVSIGEVASAIAGAKDEEERRRGRIP